VKKKTLILGKTQKGGTKGRGRGRGHKGTNTKPEEFGREPKEKGSGGLEGQATLPKRPWCSAARGKTGRRGTTESGGVVGVP